MTEKAKSNRAIKTIPFRMSFPSLLKPRENDENGSKRYELAMLFPPGLDVKPYKAALRAAMVEKFGNDPKQWPKIKRKPDDVIRDFSEFNAEAKTPLAGDWTGWIMIRANATEKNPPGVVGPVKDASGKFPVITDEREVYGGRWARASIEAFYYPKQGGGVTFGLKNVQLLKHDKKFGGAITAPEQDFDDAPDEWAGSDDFDSGTKAQAEADADEAGW